MIDWEKQRLESDDTELTLLYDRDLIKELKKFSIDLQEKIDQIVPSTTIGNIYLGADGIRGSYGYHSWQPPTDSYFTIFNINGNKLSPSEDELMKYKELWYKTIDNFIQILEKYQKSKIDVLDFSIETICSVRMLSLKIFDGNRKELYRFTHEISGTREEPFLNLM